jgi:hypothetical protein
MIGFQVNSMQMYEQKAMRGQCRLLWAVVDCSD